MILAPLLKPELKNMKAFIDAIVTHVALKSSKSKGSIYLLKSLVIMITWWSHTENLLNINEWVSETSSMKAPGSNGA